MSEFKTFDYQFQVLEHHLDCFGHVNNAKYLELFEEARWDFITTNGYGLIEVQQNKKGPVVLDLACRFKKELTNRENITIRSQSVDWKGKISHIKQEMIKSDGSIAAEANFTFGFMDLETRRLMDPPDAWLRALGIK